MFDRASGKILSGNKAPSAANIEKWLQEHPSYEVVRSTSKNIPNTKVKKINNNFFKEQGLIFNMWYFFYSALCYCYCDLEILDILFSEYDAVQTEIGKEHCKWRCVFGSA